MTDAERKARGHAWAEYCRAILRGEVAVAPDEVPEDDEAELDASDTPEWSEEPIW